MIFTTITTKKKTMDNFKKGQIDRLKRLGFQEDDKQFYLKSLNVSIFEGNYEVNQGLEVFCFTNFERLISFLKDLAN